MPYGAKGLRPGPKARRLSRTEEIESEEKWIGEEVIIIDYPETIKPKRRLKKLMNLSIDLLLGGN